MAGNRRFCKQFVGIAVLTMILIASEAAASIRSVGVLPFRNESGTDAPASISTRLARGLQQQLLSIDSGRVVRLVGAEESGSTSIPELVEIGTAQGVDAVVRGGLLLARNAGAGTASEVSIELYADVISTRTSQVTSVRSRGSSPAGALGSALWSGGEEVLDAGPVADALGEAIERLAQSVRLAIAEMDGAPAPAGPGATSIAPGPAATGAPDTGTDATRVEGEEEILQQAAEVEATMGSGALREPGDEPALASVLRDLTIALSSRADQLARGEDPKASDEAVARTRAALEQLLDRAARRPAALEPAPDTRGKDWSESVNGHLDSVLEVLGRIREVRSGLGALSQEGSDASPAPTAESPRPDPSATQPGDPDPPVVEEALGEIGGIVTEGGHPLEGVTVMERASGLTTRTDAEGAYTLPGVEFGLVSLSVTRAGAEVAADHVSVVKGRPAVADFEIAGESARPSTTSRSRRARVLGATAYLSSTGANIGTIRGSAVDDAGRPVARAIIVVNSRAVARTDSRGGFTLLRAPAGQVPIEVRSPNGRATQVVRVGEGAVSKAELRLTSARAPGAVVTSTAQPSSSSTVRGRVFDEQRGPVPAVRVRLIPLGSSRGVSTLSRSDGTYAIRGVAPGQYRVVAQRDGFQTGSATLRVTSVAVRAPDLALARSRVAIRGTVKDREGRAYGGIVRVLRDGGRVASVTCKQGGFAISDLAPGTYSLLFRSSSGFEAGRTVEVVEGRATLAPMIIEMGRQQAAAPRETVSVAARPQDQGGYPLVIRGTVSDPEGRTYIDGTVRVLREGREVGSVRCTKGVFLVYGLAAGTYSLIFKSTTGQEEAGRTVTVVPGRVVTAPMVVEMSRR